MNSLNIARLIIAGGRDFDSYDMVVQALEGYNNENCIVISGTARGADQLGEQVADNKAIRIVRCPAQWNKYGKSAGYKRNALMADMATHLIAFWDGESRGTNHMINLANDRGLDVTVIRYTNA